MESERLIRVCCVCKRVEDHGIWRESDFDDLQYKVTHTYCPTHYGEALIKIREENGSNKT